MKFRCVFFLTITTLHCIPFELNVVGFVLLLGSSSLKFNAVSEWWDEYIA